MAKIYNSDCTKGLAKNAGIQINADKVPNELAEKIVPTFETNPAALRICNIIRSNGGTGAATLTIYTTPSNQDFYLCGGILGQEKDAASDNIFTSIRGTVGGAVTNIASIRSITLTASKVISSFTISPPLKVDRNTNIELLGSFTVGNIAKDANIWGYIEESSA